MAPEERRRDRDGNWYTEEEFWRYYGDGSYWGQARKRAGRNTAQGNAEEFHGGMDTIPRVAGVILPTTLRSVFDIDRH